MNSELYEKARRFIYDNGRLLERRMFEYLFENGSREAVVAAVKAYQNPGGGFGNAMEPDKRVPFSQPLDVQLALEALDRCGALREPQVIEEMLLPACGFLESACAPDGGLTCVLPSANDYSHTPWWAVDPAQPRVGDLNPTAAIAGLLLKSGVRHAWLAKAVDFCWREIEKLGEAYYHTHICVLAFLAHTPERERADRQLARLERMYRKPGVIEMDPDAGGYVQMPLDWAPTPEHFCRKLFDDATLDLHLMALKKRQKPDGGWPITWDAISPGVELEWRGIRTLDALVTLKAYHAL